MLTLTNEWIEEGIEQGRATEARTLIQRLGTKRFGAPDPAVEASLVAADILRLEALSERLLEVESWQELLDP